MATVAPKDRLIIQFSTTAHNTLKLRWENRWSEIIRRAGHTQFSHVDLVLEDGNLLGSSDNPGCPVIQGNPRGVAIRPPDYQLFGYRRQAIIATERARDIREIAKTQIGKNFDISMVKGMIDDSFPGARDWRLDNDWFCGELIAWAMEAGQFWGPHGLNWPKNRVSPTDLLLVMLGDQRWLNADTFWMPVPGLILCPGET